MTGSTGPTRSLFKTTSGGTLGTENPLRHPQFHSTNHSTHRPARALRAIGRPAPASRPVTHVGCGPALVVREWRSAASGQMKIRTEAPSTTSPRTGRGTSLTLLPCPSSRRSERS
jgi:hypothetical protein